MVEFPNPYLIERKDSVGEASQRLANALAPALTEAGGPNFNPDALAQVLQAIFDWTSRRNEGKPET